MIYKSNKIMIKIVQNNTIDFSIYDIPNYADLHGIHTLNLCLEIIEQRFPNRYMFYFKIPFVLKWLVFII